MKDKYIKQFKEQPGLLDRLQEHVSIAAYVPVDEKMIQMSKYKVKKQS